MDDKISIEAAVDQNGLATWRTYKSNGTLMGDGRGEFEHAIRYLRAISSSILRLSYSATDPAAVQQLESLRELGVEVEQMVN